MTVHMQHDLGLDEPAGVLRADVGASTMYLTIGVAKYPVNEGYTLAATTPDQLLLWLAEVTAAIDRLVEDWHDATGTAAPHAEVAP